MLILTAIYGAIGGLADFFVLLYQHTTIQEQDQIIRHLKTGYSLVRHVSLMFLGLMIAVGHEIGGSTLSPLLAINVGATGPLILSVLAGHAEVGTEGLQVG